MPARAHVLSLIAVTVIGAGVAGCHGTSSLRDDSQSTTATTGSDATDPAAYLASLRREQNRLAVAERAIPSRPRTPAQLARSIGLLGSAIGRLGDDLAAIRPPDAVAGEHARLVSLVRAYRVRLTQAAREAVAPDGALRAGDMLVSATTDASSKFTSIVSEIHEKLGQ